MNIPDDYLKFKIEGGGSLAQPLENLEEVSKIFEKDHVLTEAEKEILLALGKAIQQQAQLGAVQLDPANQKALADWIQNLENTPAAQGFEGILKYNDSASWVLFTQALRLIAKYFAEQIRANQELSNLLTQGIWSSAKAMADCLVAMGEEMKNQFQADAAAYATSATMSWIQCGTYAMQAANSVYSMSKLGGEGAQQAGQKASDDWVKSPEGQEWAKNYADVHPQYAIPPPGALKLEEQPAPTIPNNVLLSKDINSGAIPAKEMPSSWKYAVETAKTQYVLNDSKLRSEFVTAAVGAITSGTQAATATAQAAAATTKAQSKYVEQITASMKEMYQAMKESLDKIFGETSKLPDELKQALQQWVEAIKSIKVHGQSSV